MVAVTLKSNQFRCVASISVDGGQPPSMIANITRYFDIARVIRIRSLNLREYSIKEGKNTTNSLEKF